MRIGEFSREHNATIDTVRHYIELGLILPVRVGAHFYFDDTCSKDIEEIRKLKALRFTLHEIQKLFIIKRFSKLEKRKDREYYTRFFIRKKKLLTDERNHIEKVITEIDKITKNLQYEAEKENNILGVPLSFLNIAECPECKGTLSLNSAHIDKNMIINGVLSCCCGFTCKIDNGIIIAGEVKESDDDLNESIYDYFENTSHEYMNFMYKTIEWIVRRIDFNSLSGNIILEPGSGFGFLLKQIEAKLPQKMLYLSVDHNLKSLRYLKKHMELYSKNNHFIFICSDLQKIPIRDCSVDKVFDYFGSTNYNFENSNFLMSLLSDKVKNGGLWYGMHFCLDRNSKTVLQFPLDLRNSFYMNSLLLLYQQSNFRTLETDDLGYISSTGKMEPFHIEGDNMHVLAYNGCKTSG